MLINSIYEDVKYDHLSGYFFVNDPNAYSLASIIYIVDYV